MYYILFILEWCAQHIYIYIEYVLPTQIENIV